MKDAEAAEAADVAVIAVAAADYSVAETAVVYG